MPESKRLPVSPVDEAALRDQQIDTLLDDGLDRYFASRYEEAIHLWTRVLFLDRSHARARAYIERARTALAEMQRRSDELLQASRDLLEQGKTDAARQLLTEAVATSGDDVAAAALRARLERLERAGAVGRIAEDRPPIVERTPFWAWGRTPGRAVGAGLVLVLLFMITAMFVQGGTNPQQGRDNAIVVAPAPGRLTVLSSSEVALVRARTAFERGRLSEALRVLDRVSLDSPERVAADQLRIEIQQLLTASVRSSSATPLTEPVRR